jgi:SAM-dependent methyltransferase
MKKRLIKPILPSKGRLKFKQNYNFKFHIIERFFWMKKYIFKKKNIIEIGSGNGLSKKILGKKIITSDIFNSKWLDLKIDMNKMNLPRKYLNNVDIFIFNHSLHHSNNPFKVFKKIEKYLKKDGLILINDPEISFFFKFFLKICNHEMWTFKKDIWKDNNATAHILFNNKKINSAFYNDYLIKKNELNEFLIFLNSGGNGVEAPYIPLGKTLLNFIKGLDKFLILILPRIFALNRSVILKKIK